MDEYVCVTLQSQPNEPASAFGKRLTAFWSHFLRTFPDEYDRVYAETTQFESLGDRQTRQYMVGADVAELLSRQLTEAGIEHDPLDLDDLYSKFEATPPQWFQIPH